MTCAPAVAHRAFPRLRPLIPVVAALAVAATATLATRPSPAEGAYAPRVVIVVGPSGGATRDYLGKAREYAAQARALGADVTSVLTPHATWARVLAAAQGANVFIYLGHGNGWPSPYAPYQGLTKDGLGLNPWDGSGNSRVRYYGEELVRAQIRLAPGAIVLLNRLCYASGNGEPGSAEPSWATAVKRADNFAAGFLQTGASAVLADGHTSLVYELAILFGRNRNLAEAWAADPDANGHSRSLASTRTGGTTVRLDPDRKRTGFYRSLATRADAMTGNVRIAALSGTLRVSAAVRTDADTSARPLGTLSHGAKVVVRGALTTDGAGRTWVPVMTLSGQAGYVAAWLTAFSGSARARTDVILRASASTRAARRAVVRGGIRVTVIGSAKDRSSRAWLKVRTPSGRTGWVAAWLTMP
jgi:hypothetical protein